MPAGIHQTGRLPQQTLLKGQYLVLDVIGKGGMGAVYLAMDTSSRRRVAVKEMGTSNVTPDRLNEIHARFEQEADILRRLNHPNLPHFYDYFYDGGRSYIVMDFIEGQTLAHLLAENYWQPLPLHDVLRYAKQLSSVLNYLHTYHDEYGRLNPLVFRDLKLANVIITPQGQVFLIDFGIARFFTDPAHDVMGTLGYSPPEQFYGRTTPRSDLYSLGATLYVCLTGHDPKNNTPNVFNFPPVRNLNNHVPPDVEILLRWLLATLETDRPESAARVLQTLQDIEQHAAEITTDLATNPQGTGIGGLGANFYDEKTARAAQYHAWLIHVNKLPGLLGRQWATYIIPVLSRGYGAVVGFLLKLYGGKALLNAFSRPVWTPHFWLLFLLSLLFSLGGSIYLMRIVHLSPYTIAFYLAGILALLAFIVGTHKDITSPLSHSILHALSLMPLLLCAGLLGLPTVQHTLQVTTVNQVLCVALVALGGCMLLRPDKRFYWLDHITLAAAAVVIVVLQSILGPQELLQLQPHAGIGVSAAYQYDQYNTLLIVVAASIGVITMLTPFRPFGRFSHLLVFLLAVLDLGLQLALGRAEILPLLQGNKQILWLSPELLYAVLATGPALLALILLPFKSSRLGRVPLFVLICSLAYVQSQVGVSSSFASWQGNPLAATLPNLFSFYQLIAYGLVLMAAVLLFRLRRTFTRIDRIAIFGVAGVATVLQSSTWLGNAPVQAVALLSNAAIPINMGNDTPGASLMIGLNEGTAWLLGVVVVALLLLTALAIFIKLGHHATKVVSSMGNQNLSWLEKLTTRTDHIMILLVSWTCLLLHLSLGKKEQFLAQSFTIPKIHFTFTLYMIVLGMLALSTIIALLRLGWGYGFWERLVVFWAALACALLLFGDQGGTYIMPITPTIPQSVTTTLSFLPQTLIFLSALITAALALLWLRNPWQAGERTLLVLLFGGAFVCAIFQLAQPPLLIASLILLIQGLLLATQIEKVR